MNATFWGASSRRAGSSSGRSPTRSERSATRAARFAERTEAKVASARMSVPPAVASAEIVTQSAASSTAATLRRAASLRPGNGVVGRFDRFAVAREQLRDGEPCEPIERRRRLRQVVCERLWHQLRAPLAGQRVVAADRVADEHDACRLRDERAVAVRVPGRVDDAQPTRYGELLAVRERAYL